MVEQQLTNMSLPALPEGRKWVVQSTMPPMFLESVYDEQQLWLPFVEHAYFQVDNKKITTYEDTVQRHEASKDAMTKAARRTYALNSESDRYVYLWKKDFEQRVIPFPEHRMISNNHWKRLQKENYPGWDRNSEGQLLEIMVSEEFINHRANTQRFTYKREQVSEWCKDNTRGCFHVTTNAKSVIFERDDDAMLFKLSFDH